jgi:hypothetical protein
MRSSSLRHGGVPLVRRCSIDVVRDFTLEELSATIGSAKLRPWSPVGEVAWVLQTGRATEGGLFVSCRIAGSAKPNLRTTAMRKQRSLSTVPRTGQIDPKRSVTRSDKLELSTRDLRDSVRLDQEVCPSCCNRFRDEDRSITNKPAASPTLTAAEATKTPIAPCTPPVSIKAVPIDGAAA